MKDLSSIKKAALEKSARLNRDTAEVVSTNIPNVRVSVSTKQKQKSILKVIDERNKELGELNKTAQLVKEDAQTYSANAIAEAQKKAQDIINRAKKIEVSAASTKLSVEKQEQNALEMLNRAKMAQNQTEEEKRHVDTLKEELKEGKALTIARNNELRQAIKQVEQVLGGLTELIQAISSKLEPIVDDLDSGEARLQEMSAVYATLAVMIERELTEIEAKEQFLDARGIQQDKQWAIIKDNRRQLELTANELRTKANGK